jgi:hypothetical protein
MARQSKKIKLNPVLLIACEGTSTEYEYFTSWGQTEQALNSFSRVVIYPGENDENPKTTPYQLYEYAKAALKDQSADIAWVIFDKDMHPRLQETFQEAYKYGVKVAFSARSFEEWILLHFEKKLTAFQATECKKNNKPINCGSTDVPDCDPVHCLSGHIRRANHIAGYSKKRTFDLYSHIVDKTEKAFVNAAWLRFRGGCSLLTGPHKIHNFNPYCDIDQLVLLLKGRHDVIEWGSAGKVIAVHNFSIDVVRTDNTIRLSLSHTKAEPLVVNSLFDSTSFFTTDDTLNNRTCVITTKNYLIQNAGSSGHILYPGDTIEYVFQRTNDPYFLFRFPAENIRIYVEL